MSEEEKQDSDEGEKQESQNDNGMPSKLRRVLVSLFRGLVGNSEFAQDGGGDDESILDVLQSPEALLVAGGTLELARNFTSVSEFISDNLETISACGVTTLIFYIETRVQVSKLRNIYFEDLAAVDHHHAKNTDILPEMKRREEEAQEMMKSGIHLESETDQGEQERKLRFIFLTMPVELRTAREHIKSSEDLLSEVAARMIEYERWRLNPTINGVSGSALVGIYLVAACLTYGEFVNRKTAVWLSCCSVIWFCTSYGYLSIQINGIRDNIKRRIRRKNAMKQELTVEEHRFNALQLLNKNELQFK